MVVPIRLDEGKGAEALDDGSGCLWSRKSLKDFLQVDAGSDDNVRAGERLDQRLAFGLSGGRVASKSEGPHAGVDEQAHLRDRSVL